MAQPVGEVAQVPLQPAVPHPPIALDLVQDGARRMLDAQEDVFYYVTVANENYPHPSMPEGAMVYNATHNVLQYCNGEGWIGVGQ